MGWLKVRDWVKGRVGTWVGLNLGIGLRGEWGSGLVEREGLG